MVSSPKISGLLCYCYILLDTKACLQNVRTDKCSVPENEHLTSKTKQKSRAECYNCLSSPTTHLPTNLSFERSVKLTLFAENTSCSMNF